MNTLKGIVYQSGTIEFQEADNRWAFSAIKAGMKSASGRVVLDPKKAPIELIVSDKANADEMPWLDELSLLLATADRVYLKPVQESLRFQQANHEIKKNQQLITLGGQADVDEYAKLNWSRIKYFYAFRHDNFRFDIKRMMSHRDGHSDKTKRIELITRLLSSTDRNETHITFDATGADASIEIINWRSSVNEGDTKRFLDEGMHCEIKVQQVKRPITFFHEYREEFKNHAYEFEGENRESAMSRVGKRIIEMEAAAEMDDDDFEISFPDSIVDETNSEPTGESNSP
jgi:hypothetical protein